MGGCRNSFLYQKKPQVQITAFEKLPKPFQSHKSTSLKFQRRSVSRLAPAIYMQYLHIPLMPIVEIQCIILCHKAEQSAGLKFFEPAIKVENWQMEIEYFHNHITAWKETVALHPVLKRPKMMCITAIPTTVELNSIGIFHGNHTQQREPAQSIKHRGNKKLQR